MANDWSGQLERLDEPFYVDFQENPSTGEAKLIRRFESYDATQQKDIWFLGRFLDTKHEDEIDTDTAVRFVVDPEAGGEVYPGKWVCIYVGRPREEDDEGIIQILVRGFVQSAAINEVGTYWVVLGGGNNRGSNEGEMLELRNCDPEQVVEMSKANAAKTYTNAIHTLNGGLLEGTLHNIRTDWFINPETGLATIRWLVSKQANCDVHFSYDRNDRTNVVDYYKFDAADTGLASFEKDYYFDALNNWYISTDGENYSSKNGVAVDPVVALPVDVPSLGNVQGKDIPGRTVVVDPILRDPASRFYSLHVHIEFRADATHSVAVRRDAFAVVTHIVHFADSINVAGFAAQCQVDTNTGLVEVSSAPQGGDYKALAEKVEGRTVEIGEPVYDEQKAKVRISVEVIHYALGWDCKTWLANPTTRKVELYIFGANDTEVRNALNEYYFNAVGDVFHSTNSGADYAGKNGDNTLTGSLSSENAHPLSEAGPVARAVAAVETERNPTTGIWVLKVAVEFATVLSVGNVGSYGTPDVMVTDVLVVGASELKDATASVGYNAQGTKETSTQLLQEHYDKPTGTYSYIFRTVVKWAPLCVREVGEDWEEGDPVVGDAGWIEGPSELKLEVDPATLARGVGSGFGVAGAWSGGGKVRIRKVAGADGMLETDSDPTNTTTDTVQVSKEFRPYNITVARRRRVRTRVRQWFTVRRLAVNEYPAGIGAPIEDLGIADVGTAAFPVLVSVTVEDDYDFGASPVSKYGPFYNQDYMESLGNWFGSNQKFDTHEDVFGKIVTYTYSDGTFTLAYYRAMYIPIGDYSYNGVGNTHWHELLFTRTYAAGEVPVYDFTLASGPDQHNGEFVIGDDEFAAADPGTDGHYAYSVDGFMNESIRHQQERAGTSLFVLSEEIGEATGWEEDTVNSWILNPSGADMQFRVPPETPPSRFI